MAVDAYEAQQARVFTRWLNSFLAERQLSVTDIFSDLADGIKLLNLLEILTGETVRSVTDRKINRRPRMRIQMIENCNSVVSFVKKKGIPLVNIGGQDIVDGNHNLILGLIFTLILHFGLKFSVAHSASGKNTPKQNLLAWCALALPNGPEVREFSSSWRDGKALCRIVNHFRPELLSLGDVGDDARSNVELALSAGEAAGISRVVEVEDVVREGGPDEKSMIAQLGLYTQIFGDPTAVAAPTPQDHPQESHASERELREMFEFFGSTNDGTLSEEALLSGLRVLGVAEDVSPPSLAAGEPIVFGTFVDTMATLFQGPLEEGASFELMRRIVEHNRDCDEVSLCLSDIDDSLSEMKARLKLPTADRKDTESVLQRAGVLLQRLAVLEQGLLRQARAEARSLAKLGRPLLLSHDAEALAALAATRKAELGSQKTAVRNLLADLEKDARLADAVRASSQQLRLYIDNAMRQLASLRARHRTLWTTIMEQVIAYFFPAWADSPAATMADLEKLRREHETLGARLRGAARRAFEKGGASSAMADLSPALTREALERDFDDLTARLNALFIDLQASLSCGDEEVKEIYRFFEKLEHFVELPADGRPAQGVSLPAFVAGATIIGAPQSASASYSTFTAEAEQQGDLHCVTVAEGEHVGLVYPTFVRWLVQQFSDGTLQKKEVIKIVRACLRYLDSVAGVEERIAALRLRTTQSEGPRAAEELVSESESIGAAIGDLANGHQDDDGALALALAGLEVHAVNAVAAEHAELDKAVREAARRFRADASAVAAAREACGNLERLVETTSGRFQEEKKAKEKENKPAVVLYRALKPLSATLGDLGEGGVLSSAARESVARVEEPEMRSEAESRLRAAEEERRLLLEALTAAIGRSHRAAACADPLVREAFELFDENDTEDLDQQEFADGLTAVGGMALGDFDALFHAHAAEGRTILGFAGFAVFLFGAFEEGTLDRNETHAVIRRLTDIRCKTASAAGEVAALESRLRTLNSTASQAEDLATLEAAQGRLDDVQSAAGALGDAIKALKAEAASSPTTREAQAVEREVELPFAELSARLAGAMRELSAKTQARRASDERVRAVAEAAQALEGFLEKQRSTIGDIESKRGEDAEAKLQRLSALSLAVQDGAAPLLSALRAASASLESGEGPVGAVEAGEADVARLLADLSRATAEAQVQAAHKSATFQAVFAFLDRDSSGDLTRDEFLAACEWFIPALPDQEREPQFRAHVGGHGHAKETPPQAAPFGPSAITYSGFVRFCVGQATAGNLDEAAAQRLLDAIESNDRDAAELRARIADAQVRAASATSAGEAAAILREMESLSPAVAAQSDAAGAIASKKDQLPLSAPAGRLQIELEEALASLTRLAAARRAEEEAAAAYAASVEAAQAALQVVRVSLGEARGGLEDATSLRRAEPQPEKLKEALQLVKTLGEAHGSATRENLAKAKAAVASVSAPPNGPRLLEMDAAMASLEEDYAALEKSIAQMEDDLETAVACEDPATHELFVFFDRNRSGGISEDEFIACGSAIGIGGDLAASYRDLRKKQSLGPLLSLLPGGTKELTHPRFARYIEELFRDGHVDRAQALSIVHEVTDYNHESARTISSISTVNAAIEAPAEDAETKLDSLRTLRSALQEKAADVDGVARKELKLAAMPRDLPLDVALGKTGETYAAALARLDAEIDSATALVAAEAALAEKRARYDRGASHLTAYINDTTELLRGLSSASSGEASRAEARKLSDAVRAHDEEGAKHLEALEALSGELSQLGVDVDPSPVAAAYAELGRVLLARLKDAELAVACADEDVLGIFAAVDVDGDGAVSVDAARSGARFFGIELMDADATTPAPAGSEDGAFTLPHLAQRLLEALERDDDCRRGARRQLEAHRSYRALAAALSTALSRQEAKAPGNLVRDEVDDLIRRANDVQSALDKAEAEACAAQGSTPAACDMPLQPELRAPALSERAAALALVAAAADEEARKRKQRLAVLAGYESAAAALHSDLMAMEEALQTARVANRKAADKASEAQASGSARGKKRFPPAMRMLSPTSVASDSNILARRALDLAQGVVSDHERSAVETEGKCGPYAAFEKAAALVAAEVAAAESGSESSREAAAETEAFLEIFKAGDAPDALREEYARVGGSSRALLLETKALAACSDSEIYAAFCVFDADDTNDLTEEEFTNGCAWLSYRGDAKDSYAGLRSRDSELLSYGRFAPWLAEAFENGDVDHDSALERIRALLQRREGAENFVVLQAVATDKTVACAQQDPDTVEACHMTARAFEDAAEAVGAAIAVREEIRETDSTLAVNGDTPALSPTAEELDAACASLSTDLASCRAAFEEKTAAVRAKQAQVDAFAIALNEATCVLSSIQDSAGGSEDLRSKENGLEAYEAHLEELRAQVAGDDSAGSRKLAVAENALRDIPWSPEDAEAEAAGLAELEKVNETRAALLADLDLRLAEVASAKSARQAERAYFVHAADVRAAAAASSVVLQDSDAGAAALQQALDGIADLLDRHEGRGLVLREDAQRALDAYLSSAKLNLLSPRMQRGLVEDYDEIVEELKGLGESMEVRIALKDEEIKEIFDYIDANSDGILDRQEFVDGGKDIGLDESEEELGAEYVRLCEEHEESEVGALHLDGYVPFMRIKFENGLSRERVLDRVRQGGNKASLKSDWCERYTRNKRWRPTFLQLSEEALCWYDDEPAEGAVQEAEPLVRLMIQSISKVGRPEPVRLDVESGLGDDMRLYTFRFDSGGQAAQWLEELQARQLQAAHYSERLRLGRGLLIIEEPAAPPLPARPAQSAEDDEIPPPPGPPPGPPAKEEPASAETVTRSAAAESAYGARPTRIEGYLKKKSPARFRGWQTRYFVLQQTNATLYYYTSLAKAEEGMEAITMQIQEVALLTGHAKGKVHLRDVLYAGHPRDDPNNELRIDLEIAGGKSYQLLAKHKADANAWLNGFKEWKRFLDANPRMY